MARGDFAVSLTIALERSLLLDTETGDTLSCGRAGARLFRGSDLDGDLDGDMDGDMDGELDIGAREFLFGTQEPPASASAYAVSAGALTARIEAGALRDVRFGTFEVLRQIDFPVRDENWASLRAVTLSQDCVQTAEGFRYEHRFEVADGALECCVIYTGRADGVLEAEGSAKARRDFVTNRTGFSVLHPLAGFAGRGVVVRHSAAGGQSETVMPDQIMPSQPIKDIAGLHFEIDGLSLDIGFEGEVFEMEDQRNWSDASYKTYCRPLVEPFAYTIKAGETMRQGVRVVLDGTPRAYPAASAGPLRFAGEDIGGLADMSLALDEGWFADAAQLCVLRRSGVKRVLARVTPDGARAMLAQVAQQARALGAWVDLEIVLDDSLPAPGQVARVAVACREVEVLPCHVIALPRAFLKSYQPGSVWPRGVQPQDGVDAVRVAFPHAQVGAGMLTNFTEFNRCPPRDRGTDFFTHGTSATVHAADDASVMQTLEALPHILRSARAIGGASGYRLGYRLGLSAIGMRDNPYGACTTDNPEQGRLTMAVWDPRARGLFGAAWAVGVLAATQGLGVEAIALGAPVGPFGIVSSVGEVARPWFDDHPEAQVYPVFHVLRALACGGTRVVLEDVPEGLAGVALDVEEGCRRLVLANLTDAPRTVVLPEGRFACLDAGCFEAAVLDAEWLDGAMEPLGARAHDLPPFAILFGDLRVPD